jgi:methylated-DNA-[protein]-cysteine S-methyltransferase
MFYQVIKVGKDEIGLVWNFAGGKPQVDHIYLPDHQEKITKKIMRDYPAVTKTPHTVANGIDQLIADLYKGKRRDFSLTILNLSGLTEFSIRVLKQTCRIPRGKVTAYSGLAAKIGHPRASRAVGTALANNPFPLVIPCHRVVRAGGSLGQFGGGGILKKQLLEKEGIIFDASGGIPLKNMVYPVDEQLPANHQK